MTLLAEMLVQGITRVVDLPVDFEQVNIFDHALLDEGDSAKGGADVIVADYFGQKWEDIGKEQLDFVYIVVVP